VITNRPHCKDSRAALFAKYLPGSEAALRFIGPRLNGNLATYAVRSADDANNDRLHWSETGSRVRAN
jgi:hypothetical protein